jgi:hypothetical protein
VHFPLHVTLRYLSTPHGPIGDALYVAFAGRAAMRKDQLEKELKLIL